MAESNKTDGGKVPPAEALRWSELVNYAPGAIVSRTVAKLKGGMLTLFAFDQGQSLSEHTSPFDAYVQMLDGTMELTIGGKPVTVKAGETVLMPAQVPHGLVAKEKAKMLLIMLRE